MDEEQDIAQESERVCWLYGCHETQDLYDLTPASWPDGQGAYACKEHYDAVVYELESDGNDLDLGMIEGYAYY